MAGRLAQRLEDLWLGRDCVTVREALRVQLVDGDIEVAVVVAEALAAVQEPLDAGLLVGVFPLVKEVPRLLSLRVDLGVELAEFSAFVLGADEVEALNFGCILSVFGCTAVFDAERGESEQHVPAIYGPNFGFFFISKHSCIVMATNFMG